VATAGPYANNLHRAPGRQITTPTPHHSNFKGRMLFLTPNQQCQSTAGIALKAYNDNVAVNCIIFLQLELAAKI